MLSTLDPAPKGKMSGRSPRITFLPICEIQTVFAYVGNRKNFADAAARLVRSGVTRPRVVFVGGISEGNEITRSSDRSTLAQNRPLSAIHRNSVITTSPFPRQTQP